MSCFFTSFRSDQFSAGTAIVNYLVKSLITSQKVDFTTIMARLTVEQIRQLREELKKDYSKTKANAKNGTGKSPSGTTNGDRVNSTINPRPSTMSLFEQYRARMLDGNSNQKVRRFPTQKKIKKRKRWEAPEQTIWSIGNVPEGWSWEEPDLDPAYVISDIQQYLPVDANQ